MANVNLLEILKTRILKTINSLNLFLNANILELLQYQ